MKCRCLLFTLLAAALAACGAEPVEQPAQQSTQITETRREAEILRAIEGYRLIYTFDGPAPHDVARGESFSCGSRWRRDGGRAADTGTYRIEGDVICATSAYRNICRRFLRRERDAIVFHDPERGEVAYNVHRETYCETDPTGGPSREVRTRPTRELQPLEGEALREFIRGSTMAYAPVDNLLEGFGCDGSWMQSGTRAGMQGSYRIVGSEVCVSGPTGCSRFYRHGDGYYRGRVESNGEVVVAQRIEVGHEACAP